MRIFLILVALLISAPAAFAACETSVTIAPGTFADIGTAEGKGFKVDQTVAYGNLQVIRVGPKNVLRYTAAADKVNVGEKVDCQIEDEAVVLVDVAIRNAVSEGVYAATAKTLVLLFALAVMLESALACVFRWRPFAEILNPRAVRPLVAFLLSWWLVSYFDLDLVTELVNASSQRAPIDVNNGGQVLTALILAGGSSGINSILVALGFRQVSTPATAPKPPPTKAWIAVRAVREPADRGDVDVMIGPMQTLSDTTQKPPFVGTIKGKTGLGFLSFFARDRGRFPSYGGFEVDPGSELIVVLKFKERQAVWGPHKPGAGAIIDLDLTV
ncbi:hypothetical protein AB4Z01_05590 [Inquilinus sp. YAF38]|uniref:hypothetical protein n=1 Tax=Inquilinus sp. YAF38 TaxID=3233084 RepID=UPI003F918CBD